MRATDARVRESMKVPMRLDVRECVCPLTRQLKRRLVIPAKAGIQTVELDTGFRPCDGILLLG